jgi:AcrR family transcriptional regulator
MKNTRSNIMAAARELFEKKGFAAATTKEIAALAGISEVTLFRHFSSKRELFDETLHSCLHPYSVEEFLKNDVTYDLEYDLKHIALDMMTTFRQNAPMLRMIMRDKIRDSAPEKRVKNTEHDVKHHLLAYFTAMRDAGRLGADPKMALKFFMTNITGYLMKGLFLCASNEVDQEYFDWMLGRIVAVLGVPSGKDTK